MKEGKAERTLARMGVGLAMRESAVLAMVGDSNQILVGSLQNLEERAALGEMATKTMAKMVAESGEMESAVLGAVEDQILGDSNSEEMAMSATMAMRMLEETEAQ